MFVLLAAVRAGDQSQHGGGRGGGGGECNLEQHERSGFCGAGGAGVGCGGQRAGEAVNGGGNAM